MSHDYYLDYNFKDDFEILDLNLNFKNNPINKTKKLELLFLPKIKNLRSFKIFRNLKELNIISPLISQEENINENLEEIYNLPNLSFSLDGLENLSNNLITLRLINCNLKEIDKNFTKLKFLKILSLSENKIKEIKNLHNCIELEKLFLYSNKITKIEYLQDCSKLKEIDLSDNLIIKVENLETLNFLEIINLSQNCIEDLKNINHIKFIFNLNDLKFNDENFGPNLICENENYFDHIIKLKQGLKILDYFIIKNKDECLKDTKNFYNNNFSNFINFNNSLQKQNKKLNNLIFRENNEILLINIFYQNIKNSYDEKLKKLNDEIHSKSNDNLYEESDLSIEKILNMELDFYHEILDKNKKEIIENNKNIEDNLNKKKIILNNFFIDYLDINYFLQNNSDKIIFEHYKIKILQFEYIYEFFKRFFPLNYFNNIKSVPLIVISFNNKFGKGNLSFSQFESYLEFNQYEMMVIENINNSKFEQILDIVCSGINTNNFANKSKFNKIFEQSENLNSLGNFIIILLDNNNIVKYIIYLYNLFDLVDKDKNNFLINITQNLLENNSEENVKYNSSLFINKTNENKRLNILYDKIKETEMLDNKILEQEKNIDLLLKENFDIIEEMIYEKDK